MQDWMREGVTSFLNPKTPNVDVWRLIYEEVMRRGGLKEAGDDQLNIIWHPSHLRAHEGETTEQKYLRRGNDAADRFANLGRALHVDITEIRLTMKARFDAAKNWASYSSSCAVKPG